MRNEYTGEGPPETAEARIPSVAGQVRITEGGGSFDEGGGGGAPRTRPTWVSPYGHFEVTAVTDGSWRVSDRRVPEEAASHIVAFIESRDERFEVVWLRAWIAVPELFDSLESAVDAIDAKLTTGELGSVSATNPASAAIRR